MPIKIYKGKGVKVVTSFIEGSFVTIEFDNDIYNFLNRVTFSDYFSNDSRILTKDQIIFRKKVYEKKYGSIKIKNVIDNYDLLINNFELIERKIIILSNHYRYCRISISKKYQNILQNCKKQ